MASPNARITTLKATETYYILHAHDRQAWLKKAIELRDEATKPTTGEVFQGRAHYLERLKN
jgi:hypothetical protein